MAERTLGDSLASALAAFDPQKAVPQRKAPANEAHWRQQLGNQGQITKPDTTLGDVLGSALTGAGKKLGMDERRARHVAKRATSFLNDATPVGNATGAEEGGREFKRGLTRGDLKQAAVGAAVFGLNMLPYASKAAKPARNALMDLMTDESGAIRAWHGSTEPFQKWFGGSRAVDAKGAPLTVYHGTTRDFDTFDPAQVGQNWGKDKEGYFFTTESRHSISPADGQLEANYGATEYALGDGGNIVPAYLSLKNPYTVEHWANDMNAPLDDLLKEIKDGGGIRAFDFSREELMRNAKAKGHDGIILDDLYVAFEPTQIKSATGNRGTYDPLDPRITR